MVRIPYRCNACGNRKAVTCSLLSHAGDNLTHVAGEIGAALVGQSIKGPAFVPTKVESFQEFQQVFGGLTEDSYLPYTAQSYLEEAGTATIVRILGASGYNVQTLNLTIS